MYIYIIYIHTHIYIYSYIYTRHFLKSQVESHTDIYFYL